MPTERNPWGSSSPLDAYCDSIIPRVEGTSIKKVSFNDSDDLIHRLRNADEILREKRRAKLQQRIREIESDASAIFSHESSEEIVESCRILSNTIEYAEKKTEKISHDFSNHLSLDETGRKRFHLLLKVMNILREKNCEIHEVKFAVEKLILEAKLRAMTSSNRLSALERRIEDGKKCS